MQIFSSRFTPNATGDEISLSKGEKVKYQLKDGSLIEAIIDSERMSHSACENLGYEAITLDDNQRTFIDSKRIVCWEGKMDSMEQLDRALANER
jgi:hypothetical protein